MKALRYSITSRHFFIIGELIFKPSLIVKRSYSNQNQDRLNYQYLRIISIYLIEKCKEGIKNYHPRRSVEKTYSKRPFFHLPSIQSSLQISLPSPSFRSPAYYPQNCFRPSDAGLPKRYSPLPDLQFLQNSPTQLSPLANVYFPLPHIIFYRNYPSYF